jgi:sugar lactone lactonase YvrE
MKSSKQFSTLMTLCFSLLLVFVSCKDDENGSGTPYDPSKPVKLTSFFPDSGRIAEKVVLLGENFGTDPSKIRVYFNWKQAKVIGSTGDAMYVVCPKTPGDTCTISVVVGNDSLTYAQTFRYKISVSVSTITGKQGIYTFAAGSLADATLRPRYLCIDDDNNLFVVQRSDGLEGLIRVSEEGNEVVQLASGMRAPNALCVDRESGTLMLPADEPTAMFYTADPLEGWAVRTKNMKFIDGTEARIANTDGRYKHSMAFCEYDGYIYTRMRSGDIVKINPETLEAESIYQTPFGDSYGVCFHSLYPWMLYLGMGSECGENAHSICTIDVRDPQNTFQQVSAPNRNGGFRDGKLEISQWRYPCQMYFDPEGYCYVGDRDNHCIRRITPDGMVETVVGVPGTSGYKDGNKDEALFNQPWGLAVDREGTVYVADYSNGCVRKLAVE